MNNKIKCPKCGNNFDAEAALSGEMDAHYKAIYDQKLADQATSMQAEREKIEQERKRLKEDKEHQAQLMEKAVAKQVSEEQKKIEKSARESVEAEMKSLQEENDKRRAENKALKTKQVELLKHEAVLNEKEEDMELMVQKQLLEGQKAIEEKARSKEREAFELEKIKLLKQIDDNKKLAEEMKRKAEQGSMQLQGEVQELAIEDLLARTYPFDEIAEVPKGVTGADTIQTVVNAQQQKCGTIVYESKRTKAYAKNWLEKLKQDQMTCKADIAVLVTETMPSDMERFGQKDGVWICGFHEVKSVSLVLREMLIKTHSVKLAQENKGDKMELLYTYLTGNEFRQTITRIVENYDAMTNQLNSEKKAMRKIWAMREKQIWVVQENVSALFGSIKGIAGNALSTVDVLELPDVGGEERSDEE